MLGAPGGRRVGPGFSGPWRTDLSAEKSQLESIEIPGFRAQIAGVIPPFGAVPRMRPVVFWKFQKAWTSYREITCWFDGKYRRDNIETKHDKDQAGNYGSFR